ncbi:MAG: hypothetical protein JWR26_2703 [Pedosphaera sp.]|nr:hypothetical protein [Pedosphaera sp.]
MGTAVLVGCVGLGNRTFAGNVLTNAGFELDPAGQSTTFVNWIAFGPNAYNQYSAATAHSGTNYFKVYQAFSGAVSYTGVYQDIPCAPGATYTADGWAYTSSGDALAGTNLAWIEVYFRDSSYNILALYRSTIVTSNLIGAGTFPKNTWVDLKVTNQYNPASFQITNTVTSLVAPAGTVSVRYQIVLQGDASTSGGTISGGSMYFDDLTLNQTGGGVAPPTAWNIVWSDEFSGTTIKSTNWTFESGNNGGWGNNELEYYTNSTQNAYVSNGILHIVARKQNVSSFQYTSARMKSQNLYSKAYGRFEFRAKLPQGVGFWPALWLLGNNISTVNWPACGEIDVLENPGTNSAFAQGTIHYSTTTNNNHLSTTGTYTLPNGGSVTDFHSYMLEWQPSYIKWYVDGVLYENDTSWSSSTGPYPAPFNQPFFLLMNLAVGGNYVGNPSTTNINANGAFPGDMQIDYIRVYDQTAPLQISVTKTNGGLQLAWPPAIVCHLQTQTNAADAGITTNWVDVVGAANPYPVSTAPGSRCVYYRLASP